MNSISRTYSIQKPDTAFTSDIDDVLRSGFFNVMHSEVFADEDRYTLEVSVPGISKSDVRLSVENDILLIEAERKNKRRDRDETEITARHFRRSFVLPDDVDNNRITASCSNGLLVIHLERRKRQGRRILIQGSTQQEVPAGTSLVEKMKRALARLATLAKSGVSGSQSVSM